jgi:hypothetical protein
MKLVKFHPDAESEMIEAAEIYESFGPEEVGDRSPSLPDRSGDPPGEVVSDEGFAGRQW